MRNRLSFKPGVELEARNLRPHIIEGLRAALRTTPLMAKGRVVVTSGVEGVHRPDSLHYRGEAWDLRTRDLTPETVREWAILLRAELPDWDVVVESDHIHMEYDPK